MPQTKISPPNRSWFATTGLVLLLGLGACEVPQAINLNRAELMPEAAAKKVIAQWVPKYAGDDFLYISGEHVRIKSLRELIYLSANDKLMFPMPGSTENGFICHISLGETKQLVEALTALGASATLVSTGEPGRGASAPCGRVRASP